VDGGRAHGFQRRDLAIEGRIDGLFDDTRGAIGVAGVEAGFLTTAGHGAGEDGLRRRDRADVAELKQRMTDAAASVPANDISIAYWFANTELPYMAGANGAPGLMSRTVGVKNVFDDTDVEWPQISWESVLDRDPDVIALGDLTRDQETGDKLDDKIKFLETNPVTKQLTAVREKRYVVLKGADMNPSIRTVDGAEKLAKTLTELGLTD
jgi:iron complex transport system substrate-binding protein